MPLRSRREFLLGRAPRPAAPQAIIGTGCLEGGGIVCQACRDACLPLAVRFLPAPGGASHPVIDASRCTGCGECIEVCPAGAITLEKAA